MAKSSSRKINRKTARKYQKAPEKPARTRKPSAAKSARRGTAKIAPKSAPKGAPKSARWVYAFGGGKAAGRADMRNLLGGKGAGLAEMANLGLPVPPGFTITTEVCTAYYSGGKSYPKGLTQQV